MSGADRTAQASNANQSRIVANLQSSPSRDLCDLTFPSHRITVEP